MKNLLEFLSKDKTEKKISIAVYGDAMLDQYLEVNVNRISPEFPIAVMLAENENYVTLPGGAANVAYQYANFNVETSLFGLLDQDAQKCFDKFNFSTKFCKIIGNQIPRKRRFYQTNFPSARLDIEAKHYGLPDSVLTEKSQGLVSELSNNNFDCVVFSDYAKGVFKHFDNSILSKIKISIVDPKDADISKWKGCSVFKPNEQESLRLSNQRDVKDAGKYLVDYLGSNVVVTQADKGVTVFEKNGEITHINPTRKLPTAESVVGAGDCFVSFLSMCLARGMTLQDAADASFSAGTLYVQNKHNKPLSHDEIHKIFDPWSAKIISSDLNSFFSNRNYRLIFTNGCFDLLHPGHLQSLKYAKSLGDKLVVAVNTDESVSRLKPGRPIMKLQDRLSMLAAMEFVDYLVVFDEETPETVIRQIQPDVVAKGATYSTEEIVGYKIVPEVIQIPILGGYSTTSLVDKIRKS